MRSYFFIAALAVSSFAPLHLAHGQTPDPAAPAESDRDVHFARIADRMEALSTGWSDASANFDATYYDLQLDIDFDTRRIAGVARVVGRVVGQPLQTLRLDLARTMEVSAIRNTVDASLDFTHDDDVLLIELPREFGLGEQVDLHIEYAGEPAQLGFGSFTFGQVTAGPVAWTLSEPYGAREWWPGKDHPSDKADSVRVTVTVPEGLRVGSNGLLVAETTADGRSSFEWMHRYPIAPYLVSIAAGPYEVFEQTYQRPDSLAARLGELSLPILHYQYRRDGGTTLYGNWAEVADMLAVYEYWFGPYPFASEKYGHAEFTWGGGMEHQTMSSMGGTSILLVAHEVAHQWYGNLVTLHTWPHLWLNEGFASYAELLYWEAMEERYRHQFRIELESDMSRARIAPGTLVVQDTLNINNLFNPTRVYAKGSVVLHMLRRMVGDEAFREILQAYASDPDVRYGTAVTSDFHRIAEEVSGRDLDAFFHQWVTVGYGHPNYEVNWQHDGTEHTTILLTVAQTQTAPQSNIQVFEMPISILVETETGDERFVLENDARVQQYRLELESRPERVVFDPDLDLLRNADVTVSDAPELPDLETSLISIYPNPAAGLATIQYALDEAASPRIATFDALGREVMRFDVALRPPGIHEEALDLNGLAAGAYLVRLEVGDESFTRSIVVSGMPR